MFNHRVTLFKPARGYSLSEAAQLKHISRCLFVCVCLLSCSGILTANAQTNTAATPALVTAAAASRTASGSSSAPLLSADGRFLFFLSTAGNLVTNSLNQGVQDVYMRDLLLSKTICLSVSTNQRSANGRSDQLSISSDGLKVAFVSEASDLVPLDTNGVADVFVRDQLTGGIRLISRAADGTSADGPSSSPVLTADGRFVFFASAASNLAPGNSNRLTRIYRSDLTTGELLLIRPPQITDPFRLLDKPLPSDDGSRLLFWAYGSTNQLYLGIPSLGTNTLLNPLFPTAAGPSLLPDASVNSDGSVAVCTVAAWGPNPTNAGIYRVQLPNGPSEVVAPALNTSFPAQRGKVANPILSSDGLTLFFGGAPKELPNGPEAVYLWQSGTITLLSSNTVTVTGTAYPFGILAGASADSRYVAWLAYATNGVPFSNSAPLELFVQDRTSGETRLVTRTFKGTVATTGTELPSVTFCADGRLMAFQSTASDLVAGDANAASDVFLYDWGSDSLQLISAPAPALASATAPGLFSASDYSVTADGRFLVFTSSADGLTPIPTQGVPNVYLRDLVTGSNQLVSVSRDGTTAANGPCRQASISADGGWICFSSLGSNLVSGDTNMLEDVFLRDVFFGQTRLISRSDQLTLPSLASQNPAINDNGSLVGFTSSLTGYSGSPRDVYVFVRANGIQLLSAQATNTTGHGFWSGPVFSPDTKTLLFADVAGGMTYTWHLGDSSPLAITNGLPFNNRVVFSADSKKVLLNLQQSTVKHLLVYDLTTHKAVDLGRNLTGGALNSDGSLVAALSNSLTSLAQVVLVDLTQGTTNLASAAPGSSAPGNANSFLPWLTPDGRFVVYASQASNLVPGDTNSATDIFVRDQQTGTTFVLSQATAGTDLGNATSSNPILQRDGRTLVFTSFASNLSDRDFNQAGDLFVMRLPGPESDFRVLSIGRLSTGTVTLVWAAQPGASYQLEYSDTLGAQWQVLNTPVQVTGNQASAVDTSAAGKFARFYRIVQLAP